MRAQQGEAVRPVRGDVVLDVQPGRLERTVIEAGHVGVRQDLQTPLRERCELV
jgi:hypothetical protein